MVSTEGGWLQKSCAENVMGLLESQGLILATQLFSAQVFWPAEDYHQNYYLQHPENPYCQVIIAPKLQKLNFS